MLDGMRSVIAKPHRGCGNPVIFMLDGVASLAMTIRVKKDGELPYLTIPQFKKPSLRSHDKVALIVIAKPRRGCGNPVIFMLDGFASLAMTIRVKKDGELPYLTIHQFKRPSLRSPAGAAAIQSIY
jgi:FixJ family two-component response regulator